MATKENALLNNLNEKVISVSLGSVNALVKQLNGSKVDLLLCNILAPTIKTIAPEFSEVVCMKSRLVLSGLLIDQVEDITDLFASLSWELVALYSLDQWALIELCRNPQ